MALFMDVHDIAGGVSATDVAAAHREDVETQSKDGVNDLHHWVNEAEGNMFCLVEAHSAEDAHTVHREAHGLVADQSYEAEQG